jgi:Ca-activated chloride channel family protein
MKKNTATSFLIIACLILVTGIAMAAFSDKGGNLTTGITAGTNATDLSHNPVLTIDGQLVQTKVLQNSQGIVDLDLTLKAMAVAVDAVKCKTRHVDMVIVLDKSGSMHGPKINNARRSIIALLADLSPEDRFSLITYANGVQQHSGLIPVTPSNRDLLETRVRQTRAGGGTNLGAGLQAGINVLLSSTRQGNIGKVILISDGLANQGITAPKDLGQMASLAVEKEFTISTAGVGADFNEQLMAAIADQGTGRYYYLENPDAFAAVFQEEFNNARVLAARSVKVRIPLPSGVTLVSASGYPVKTENGCALFYPGNLRSGQTRKLYLSFKLPTDAVQTFNIKDIQVEYVHNDIHYTADLDNSFQIACIRDAQKVAASIDREKWIKKVIKSDFNRLKEEVALDIKTGQKENALERIEGYHSRQNTVNAAVGSAEVADNLDKDVGELRDTVQDTFSGKPAAVQRKQKINAKALQYEGYQGQRSLQ